MSQTFNLRVVNISVKNAFMPKEFYWKHLQIDSLNEAFSEAQRYQTQHFQIFAPKMPLNNSLLCVTLHMKNFSDTEREWKIIKQLSCECLVRKNRLRKKGEPHLKCLHKDVIEMRPTIAKLLPGATALVDLTFEYNLPGPQETHFTILSLGFTIKLRTVVEALEFDPTSLLITNQLAPVAIDLLPTPQQILWLFNPYSTDIKLKLISGHARLTLTNDEIVVKSCRNSPLHLTFAPNHVGCYEMKIEIVFNNCRSSLNIHGDCIESSADSLDCCFRNHSPNHDSASQFYPFVLHGDNLEIVLQQSGFDGENVIGLQNNSKNCVKFEWADVGGLASLCEISVEPKSGYLGPASTKLVRVAVKSGNTPAILPMIPLQCSISHYHKDVSREHGLPDGYFEYTDKGYYEKPSNWSPKYLTYLQSVFANVNIRVLSTQEIIKNAALSESPKAEQLMLQYALTSRKGDLSFSSFVDGTQAKILRPACSVFDEADHLLKTVISSAINGSNFGSKQKECSHDERYETLDEQTTPDNNDKAEKNSLILKLMDDFLYDCIAEISSEQRFIPPSW